jgi:hypothetical protein
MAVAKIIQKPKEYRCIVSLAIVLYRQNGLRLSKDIAHNGSLLVLCSAHFVLTDFEQRLDLNLQDAEKFTTKRWLKKGSIPSVDCVVLEPQAQEISARERRQV